MCCDALYASLIMFCICVAFVLKGLEEVSRTDIGKKIKDGVGEAAKSAMHSAESVSKGGEKLGRTNAFKAISQVRKEHVIH